MLPNNLGFITVVLTFISISKSYKETIAFIAKTWEHGASLIRVLVRKHKQVGQTYVEEKIKSIKLSPKL